MNSHIQFLFRNALASAGYYSRGHCPRAYLRRLGHQLQAACNNKSLDCLPGIDLPYAGSLRVAQFPIIVRFTAQTIYELVKQDEPNSNVLPADIQNWPVYQDDFRYFDEFAYNPIDSRDFGSGGIAGPLLATRPDIRLTLLAQKEAIMQAIQSFYRDITLPVFLFLLPVGLAWLALDLVRRQIHFNHQTVIILLFILGLLISRIMVLVIVSINSGANVTHYGSSHYLYIYLLFFLMAFHVFDGIARLAARYREKVMHPNSASRAPIP